MRWLPCPDTVYWVKAVRRLSLLLLCPAIKPVKDVQEEKMSDDLTIDVFIYFTEAAAAQAAKWSVASQMDYLAMNAAAHSGSGGGAMANRERIRFLRAHQTSSCGIHSARGLFLLRPRPATTQRPRRQRLHPVANLFDCRPELNSNSRLLKRRLELRVGKVGPASATKTAGEEEERSRPLSL